jgi:hypothetical protein
VSKEVSPAKAAANQQNALKSTGPKDTTNTRFNATKHGLRAEDITRWDDPNAYQLALSQLGEAYRPVGDMEEFLVQRIAVCMARLRRAVRMEAKFIEATLQENDMFGAAKEPEVAVQTRITEALVNKFQRYESAIENKFYRALNQLERLQRMRKGEHVAAPVAVDVAVHPG